MKIGEKKVFKKEFKNYTRKIIIERVKFDWKAAIGWFILLCLVAWLIWYRK